MTPEGIIILPYLINNFDTMDLNPKYDDVMGNRAVEIRKRINGTSVIATIERGKNKEFLITSFTMKKSNALDATTVTPGPNVRNDFDSAKVKKDIETIKEKAKKSSVIVDENGEPLVVYHGTTEDFTVFDRTKGRANMDIHGMFFSPWELGIRMDIG